MQNHSPLRYPGGKSQLAGKLAELFESKGFYDYIYVEPFAGGAGAALELLFSERAQRIWINDLDRKIYSFWKAVLLNNKEFIDLVQNCNLNLDEWSRQKEVLDSGLQDHLKLGFAAFYLNRTSFSGIIGSGPIGGYRQDGQYKLDVRFDRASLSKKIKKIHDYRRRICITNWDARRVLRRAAKINDVVLYIDPPYIEQGNRLYYSNLHEKDHYEISCILQEISNPWVLTYDFHPLIEQWYQGVNPSKIRTSYSMLRKRKENEAFVSNILAIE